MNTEFGIMNNDVVFKKIFFVFSFTVLFSLFFIPSSFVQANSDFIVGPAKNEIFLRAGESKQIDFVIVNRLSKETSFRVFVRSVETDKNGNLVPTSKKFPGSVDVPNSVNVDFGATKKVSAIVKLDKNVEPGSIAFGIFVEPSKNNQAEVISRSAIELINIVRIEGDVIESGLFNNLKISDDKLLRSDKKISLSIDFTNTGNVHLNPYGIIIVKNMFGKEIFARKIDPWYVMPKSTRIRNITISPDTFFGRYTATVMLNRGYGDNIDTKTVSFYVLPFYIPLIAVLILTICFLWFTRRGSIKAALVVFAILAGVVNVHAQMTSGNYKVQFDSVNFGGGLSQSANYSQESTFGEVATGESNSSNYNIHAGYQQMNEVFLSMTSASDVTLSPNLGSISGGTADGSTSVTVTTDGAAGYALYVNASTSPALSSGSDSFADYVLAGANPDFNFSVLASESKFGFSPEGADLISRFFDDGSSCGTGILDTTNSCWDGFATSTKQIAGKSSANNPSGTATVLRLRAKAGSTRNQQAGSYKADITFTAAAL